MADKKLDPRPFFIIGIILIIGAGGFFILGGGETEHPEFAACLAENDATMYGFDLCPNCNKQKDIIGRDAFTTYIEGTGRYVKCRPESEAREAIGDRRHNITVLPEHEDNITANTTQGQLCADNVGSGTPTWIIPQDNGSVEQVSGWRTLNELANLTACSAPDNVDGQTSEDTGDRVTE